MSTISNRISDLELEITKTKRELDRLNSQLSLTKRYLIDFLTYELNKINNVKVPNNSHLLDENQISLDQAISMLLSYLTNTKGIKSPEIHINCEFYHKLSGAEEYIFEIHEDCFIEEYKASTKIDIIYLHGEAICEKLKELLGVKAK